MRLRLFAVVSLASLVAGLAPAGSVAHAAPTDLDRGVEPVVLTGAQLPEWSRLPAEGVANPHFSEGSDRDAHNGRLEVPPDTRTGAPVEQVSAYSLQGGTWTEVPVQVDERFPYFLANGASSFAVYSGTDKELTYEWTTESWKKTAGECEARYPDEDKTLMPGFPTEDPVATLDDDDEVVFMASDAGSKAEPATLGPPGTAGKRYEIALNDPLDPTAERYVYLFLKAGGSSFDASNGYVNYERHANADQWIDRHSFAPNDPEKLGTSNATSYGPNMSGTVCDPDGTVRNSIDRFPRDGVTVTTDSYRWTASGRWMVRSMEVRRPDGSFGPDLIDRWKGRAFQQSPASQISLVGFEDEQVNWEANSALLGEKMGPVRAIRETWGADSGTNTTKTEYFYRDAVLYRYKVRVHPIPPDGLYTSWDYNHDKVGRYYNEQTTVLRTEGVPIDGVNDDLGNFDGIADFPAFFDVNDPTFNKPLSVLNWEQVSGNGDNGSLVYMFEFKNLQALENPAVVPYYRDDACFDDGTGDDPSPHPHPGDPYTDAEKEAIPCYTEAPPGYEGPYRQGAFGSHGIHYFFTHDTDNTFSPERTTEIDGQQWQWAVPTETPHAVGDTYANTVKAPLLPLASLQDNAAGKASSEIDYTGDTAAQTTDSARLSASLTSEDRAVSGAEVVFELDGSEVATATTDDNGVASATVPVQGPARESTVTVSYAGNAERDGSSDEAAFSVLREQTALGLTITAAKNPVATATLTDGDSGNGIGGRRITFSSSGVQFATAETNSTGAASTTIPKPYSKAGTTITATFAGDDFFEGSSAQAVVPRR
jgi:hypothetical protein